MHTVQYGTVPGVHEHVQRRVVFMGRGFLHGDARRLRILTNGRVSGLVRGLVNGVGLRWLPCGLAFARFGWREAGCHRLVYRRVC